MTALPQLCKLFRIKTLYAFGSRAKEICAKLNQEPFQSEHPSSDADLAVQTDPNHPMSARDRVEFALKMEDLLEVPRVDLVILNECDPFLALDAIRGELLYAEDPDAQAREELFILRRAADLAPFERQRINTILASKR